MVVRKKMGEVLIASGLITEQKLEHALLLQQGNDKRLGSVLVELGYVTENQIARALAEQLSIPYIDCSQYIISDEIKALIPRDVAQRHVVMPLEVKDNTLLLAMAAPLNLETIDEIAFRTGLKIAPAVTDAGNLLEMIHQYYGDTERVGEVLRDIDLDIKQAVEFIKDWSVDEAEVNVDFLYKSSAAPPIIKLVTMLIVNAVRARATDVHIEPRAQHVQVRYRVDGQLMDMHKIPKNLQDAVTSRIKIISNLDITNRRLPQDGSTHMKYEDKGIDIRVSTLPSVFGEKIVLRLLDKSVGLIPLTKLGIPDTMFNSVLEAFSRPQGMILVTGPTSSGKTTTLYACINQLRSDTENIVTVEDPVEYKLEGITQVSVNEAIGLRFATALRSILRQDPDTILIGEIRDLETAEIAVRAALTGHLVLSTLHTNDTVSSISRLIDVGVPAFLVSSSLTGIIAQRLLRKICEYCKAEIDPPFELINIAVPTAKHYFKGTGCSRCSYTGYYGQTGVYEFLKINSDLKRLITLRASDDDLWEAARDMGVTTLFQNAMQKVNEGITTVDEVFSKISLSAGDKELMKTDREVLDLLVDAHKKKPSDLSVMKRLGEAYRQDGNHGEAINIYLKMLEINTGDADIYFKLGKTYMDMGVFDKAMEYIKKAWEYNPSSQKISDVLKELSKTYKISI
ncbi:MAG: ATPase, T2SS/T4P/T4SS family [Dissulfurispiraceae bacterium]